jgi:hypothetical protein
MCQPGTFLERLSGFSQWSAAEAGVLAIATANSPAHCADLLVHVTDCGAAGFTKGGRDIATPRAISRPLWKNYFAPAL